MMYINYKLSFVLFVLILLCLVDISMAFMYRTADARVGIENVLPAFGTYELIDISSGTRGKISELETRKDSSKEANDESKTLERYGWRFASSTENNAITLSNVVKTMEEPMRAYKLKFKTNTNALISEPVTHLNSVEYWTNLGKTKSWQTKFCTDELKAIMTTFGIDVVSGDLSNMQGETQSMAICSTHF